uniref:Uncharacterized protein n=1 Tax=Quercus lobata TaxID=97700 RepID=A0A7N2MDN7_QUELO
MALKLKSSDNKIFEVEEPVAVQSETIKSLVEDGCANNVIPLPNVESKTLDPNDIAYVFSGYAPLSIHLVQHAERSGWRPVEEILKLLPGPHSETKRGRFSSSPSYDTLQASANIDKVADGRRSLVLVVFIGGITFAEISALRFLSAQEGMAYDLIVGTTKIVSGHILAETFVERLG